MLFLCRGGVADVDAPPALEGLFPPPPPPDGGLGETPVFAVPDPIEKDAAEGREPLGPR